MQANDTLLSLVNLAVCAAMFAKAEIGQSRTRHLNDVAKVVVVAAVILVLAALVGVQFLHQIGISLDAFNVAVGMVLSWMVLAANVGESDGQSLASADRESF
ncbi:MAG: hypothetical protein NXI22_03620 [bacterium]|nr:hypothetical protein [bacterium]